MNCILFLRKRNAIGVSSWRRCCAELCQSCCRRKSRRPGRGDLLCPVFAALEPKKTVGEDRGLWKFRNISKTKDLTLWDRGFSE